MRPYAAVVVLALALVLTVTPGAVRGEEAQPAADPSSDAPPADGETPKPAANPNRVLFALTGGKADQYFADHFEQKFMYVPSNGLTNRLVSQLIAITQIDALLLTNQTVYGDAWKLEPAPLVYNVDLKLARQVKGPDGEMWTGLYNTSGWGEDPSIVTLEGVHESFVKGFTLVFNRLDYRWPPVADVTDALSLTFGCPVHANVYLTPPGTQGFQRHFDEMDVIVVQVSGAKKWRIYEPAVELPRPDQVFKPSGDEMDTVVAEQILLAGDVLFLPRGTGHEAESLPNSGPSMHITFGVDVYDRTWELFMHTIIELALRDEREDDMFPDPASVSAAAARTITLCGHDALDCFIPSVSPQSAARKVGCEPGSECPELDEYLADEGELRLWREIAHIAVHVTASTTPEFRKVLPVCAHSHCRNADVNEIVAGLAQKIREKANPDNVLGAAVEWLNFNGTSLLDEWLLLTYPPNTPREATMLGIALTTGVGLESEGESASGSGSGSGSGSEDGLVESVLGSVLRGATDDLFDRAAGSSRLLTAVSGAIRAELDDKSELALTQMRTYLSRARVEHERLASDLAASQASKGEGESEGGERKSKSEHATS